MSWYIYFFRAFPTGMHYFGSNTYQLEGKLEEVKVTETLRKSIHDIMAA